MEVDHFNPLLTGPIRNRHGNLLAASRNCNGAKAKQWPKPEQLAKGLRLLNPYHEVDYGVHLVEDRETGEIVGLTPAGKWHLMVVGLNAPHLVRARRRRTVLTNKFLEAASATSLDATSKSMEALKMCLNDVSAEILPTAIPALPARSSK